MVQNNSIDSRFKKISNAVYVDTPEQIQFRFELAGAGVRMTAYLIDLLIRAAIVFIIALFLSLAIGWALPGVTSGILLIVFFVVEWGYFTLLEWLFDGATPGKKAVGIKVIRTDGVALDFVRSAMRNLLRGADIFPLFYATGILTMFFSNTSRRLGDIAADTMVIRHERALLRELPPMPAHPIYISPGAMAQLNLSKKSLATLDEFFRRRFLFSQERAAELASILSRPISQKLGIDDAEPEALLAGVFLAGEDARASWYGRDTGISLPGKGSSR